MTTELLAFLTQPAGNDSPPWATIVFLWLPMLLVFYVLIIVPGRRFKQEQQNLLANLKKNDEVLTQAGIIGHIVSLKETGDEVTLKLDDTSNARIRILRSTIVRVLSGPSLTENQQTEKK